MSPPSTTNIPLYPLPPGLRLRTRNLLTAYVNHNKATGLWITTINTNQNARTSSRYLKAFSFRNEQEARETAYVNAPPLLLPFDKNPHCFVCEVKFTLIRRASHCRNCGICICKGCSTNWSKLMIPETYNAKNTRSVKVCKTCTYLATAFRHALLKGNYELAQSIYMTGNINLRCPFMNVKKGNEIMLPVHCAAQGGSLKVLSWLVDVHHCPLKMINMGNRNRSMSEDLITTSRNRSVLDIAILIKDIGILRYLVQQKKVPVNDRKNRNHASLVALEAVLKAFPEAPISKSKKGTHPEQYRSPARNKADSRTGRSKPCYEINDSNETDDTIEEYNDSTEEDVSEDADDEQSVATTVEDPCVICYDKTIDCVLTPCGHQICCLDCSKEMSKCPICTSSFESIRIFRP